MLPDERCRSLIGLADEPQVVSTSDLFEVSKVDIQGCLEVQHNREIITVFVGPVVRDDELVPGRLSLSENR